MTELSPSPISACQDVSSVGDAGADLSFEVRVVGRGIVTQRCARGTRKLPSRQLVDLQFGLVDTHSAD